METGRNVSYKGTFQKKGLPSCPLCRGTPEYNILELTVDDKHRGRRENAPVLLAFLNPV